MSTCEAFSETSADGVLVRGFLHSPEGGSSDGLVLTHGAGANCNALLLVALAEAFCAAGVTVLRCDLPFRQARPQGPPPRGNAQRDQQGLRAAVESVRGVTARVFLGGHSYGGRQASMLAAAEPGVAEALLLLSYPLHPPQRPDELRTAHFPSLQTPALFVSGARDGFGSVAEMEAALKLIPARTELVTIAGAGHELATKKNREAGAQRVVEAFRSFLEI
jgi:uncharacterized protein